MGNLSGVNRKLLDENAALKRKLHELEQLGANYIERQETLGFSQRQLRLLIDGGPDFFFLKNLDLRYELVNKANARFFGRDEADILGKTDLELMPPEAAAACQQSDQLAIQEKRLVVTVEPVGDRFYETHKFPVIIGDNVVGVAGIVRDITDHKRAEEALRESEELQNTILSNVGAYIYLKDTQYHYTYVNSKVCSLFGFEKHEIIGKDDTCFFSPASVEEIMKSDRRVIERGETITREEVNLTSSDKLPRTYWVVKLPLRDRQERIYGLCGISTDITDHKRGEEALRESEERLRYALETVQLGAWDLDLRDHSAMRSLEHDRIFGYEEPLPTWTYETFLEHILPEDRQMVDNKCRHAIKTQGDWNFECRIRRIDGTVRWIWTTGHHQTDNIGAVRRMSGIIQDITSRKQTEETLKSLLSEKEILLREVHHRIKNNMNTIMALLSVQSNALKDSPAVSSLEDARCRVRSMMVLYDKLYRSKDFRAISTRDYLRALIGEIVENFPNHGQVTVETEIDDHPLDAKILSPIGIIINELVTNILKHAFVGKTKGLIRVSFSLKDHRASLTVHDDGVGLPESVDLEGTAGFGLQLVSLLAEQLDGAIRIEKKQGTRFVLEFGV